MKIRVSQYSGTGVTNSSTVQFIALVDPSIDEFNVYKTEGTASYESTIGENVTYEHFMVHYGYGTKELLWHSLQFHKLIDTSWVMKLTEDMFLSDEYYYSNQDGDGQRIATFGIEDVQIDLSNLNEFKHSHIEIYQEAFCSLQDIKDVLRSDVSGRITIGEKNTSIGKNTISIKDTYKIIRQVWADMSMNLSYRYTLPIRIQSSVTKEYLKIIAAKKVAYEIYVMLYPSSKFGDKPSTVYRWYNDYKRFVKDIAARPLSGILNKIPGSGASFNIARS